MLTVGVKKVIVDDVTAVDEESEIRCKFDKEYLNLFNSKTRLKHWTRFSRYIVQVTICVLHLLAGALEDMDVAIVTMFPRFAWDEPPEFGRMLDDFWLCVPPSELVVFTTGTVIDF